jgi:hypothetical protein
MIRGTMPASIPAQRSKMIQAQGVSSMPCSSPPS